MKHKSLLLISIAFFMFILASDVSAESNILGWEKAKWGMTQGQVRKIYDIQWSNDGKKRCFWNQKIDIKNQKFTVYFWFDQESPTGRLYKVSLASMTYDARDDSMYDNVLYALIRRYGKPDSTEITGGECSLNCYRFATWMKSSGKLTLKILEAGYQSAYKTIFCHINYISTESDTN